MKLKECSRCKEKKSISAFYKNNNTKDKLTYYCKNCIKLYYNFTERNQKYYKKHPWAKTQRNILSRLKNNPRYKNILNFLKVKDLKLLWFRDKAYLMERPSIDRINPDGHYVLDNCRFIELRENQKGRWSQLKSYN